MKHECNRAVQSTTKPWSSRAKSSSSISGTLGQLSASACGVSLLGLPVFNLMADAALPSKEATIQPGIHACILFVGKAKTTPHHPQLETSVSWHLGQSYLASTRHAWICNRQGLKPLERGTYRVHPEHHQFSVSLHTSPNPWIQMTDRRAVVDRSSFVDR